MASNKNKYSSIKWEYNLGPKSWIYKKHDKLDWEVYDHDNLSPYEEMEFNGEYIGRFDKESFKDGQWFANGEYYNDIPMRKKLTNRFSYDEYYYKMLRENNNKNKRPIVNMNVPSEFAENWVHFNLRDYMGDYSNRKNLIIAYLKNFNEEKCLLLKEAMSNNNDIESYVWFLDIAFDAMSQEQKYIYEDIVKFYEEVYRAELVKEQEIAEQIKLSKEAVEQIKLDPVSIEATKQAQVTPVSVEVAQENQADPIFNDYENNMHETIIESEQNKPLDQTSVESEQNKPLDETKVESEIITSEQYKIIEKPQAPMPGVYNLQQNQINIDSVAKSFVANDQYINNNQIIPNTHFKNLYNVPQCYNIADLIYARKKAEIENYQLVTEMVSDQINTNNSAINNNHIEQQKIPSRSYR